jgi:hypothetical protein
MPTEVIPQRNIRYPSPEASKTADEAIHHSEFGRRYYIGGQQPANSSIGNTDEHSSFISSKDAVNCKFVEFGQMYFPRVRGNNEKVRLKAAVENVLPPTASVLFTRLSLH